MTISPEPTPAPPAPTAPPRRPSLLAKVYAWATTPANQALVHRLVTAALAVYVAIHRAGV